jgi:hypothetical protein
MTKARDLADYTGLQADLAGLQTNITAGDTAARAGRKNLIINGGFNVSQRGSYTTATTTNHLQYYLDRFYVAKAGVTGTIQDTGFAVKLVATSSATGSLRITQPLEDMARLSGKTVTLSCQMKSNASTNSRIGIFADGWQSATAAHTGGGAWETLSITLTLPAGITTELSVHAGFDGVLSANIPISSGDYCEVKDFQLELGSVATDFEYRSYGEESALCQRYYYKVQTGVDGGYGYRGGNGSIYSFNSTAAFPVQMRAAPTTVVSGGTLDGCSAYSVNTTTDGYISRVSPDGTGRYRAYEQNITFSAEL